MKPGAAEMLSKEQIGSVHDRTTPRGACCGRQIIIGITTGSITPSIISRNPALDTDLGTGLIPGVSTDSIPGVITRTIVAVITGVILDKHLDLGLCAILDLVPGVITGSIPGAILGLFLGLSPDKYPDIYPPLSSPGTEAHPIVSILASSAYNSMRTE